MTLRTDSPNSAAGTVGWRLHPAAIAIATAQITLLKKTDFLIMVLFLFCNPTMLTRAALATAPRNRTTAQFSRQIPTEVARIDEVIRRQLNLGG